MKKYFREPISGFTHLFGAIISLIGLIALIYKQFHSESNPLNMLSVIIFGLSLIFLYSASSLYHLTISSDRVIKNLRRLDHSMIFVLIAGTYTPVCLIALESYWRWTLFILVWAFAILGIFFKYFWVDCPKWLSACIYVFLGWIAIFAISPLKKVLPIGGIFYLVLGGILYTLGAVIYCFEKKNIKRDFGPHEIFHIFVLLGSLSHYFFIFKYVM